MGTKPAQYSLTWADVAKEDIMATIDDYCNALIVDTLSSVLLVLLKWLACSPRTGNGLLRGCRHVDSRVG
jgi:hypothetical protein